MATKLKTRKPEVTTQAPRTRKPEEYKRGRFQKRIKHSGPKLLSGWQNFKTTIKVIAQNWRIFGGITLVYAILTLLFVRSLGQGQLISIKAGQGNSLGTGLSLVGKLFNSLSNATDQSGSAYQSVLFVIISLVVIWTLRQIYAHQEPQKISLKKAFYSAAYPLVQFVLVLLVISLQLIPLVVGAAIYSIIVNNNLAVGGIEKLAWGGLFLVLAVWSLYMVTSSIFAMYIVTLPDVTPMQALRSAKDLVRHRRWVIMRKLLVLPLIVLGVFVFVMLPVVLWLTVVAEWVFLFLSLGVLVVAHAYIYNLYREML